MAPATRLLYVDDEPTLLEIAKIFLEAKGDFIVDTLTSANEALVVLNTVKYDAIISDYQMPDMDGITFLKKLKASGNTTPFIIFTGRGREEIVIQALNEGADFYLQKGGEPRSQFAELAHKIHQAVHQREAAASIRDLERREADIINFLPDATFAIDTQGVVIAWNRAMEKMTGVAPDRILGKGNYEYSIPFYHERRPILIDLVLKDDPVTAGKYPAIKRDGTTLFSEITIPHFNNGGGAALWFTATPLYDTQGNIIGAIESIREITERVQVKEALRESEKRFRELSDLLPLIIYETDTCGNLTYANHIAFEQFGYSEEEFRKGLNVIQMIAPVDRERAATALRAMSEGRKKTEPAEEYLALRKDGSTFHIVIYSSPVFVNDRVTGLRGIILDVTERKRAEDAIRESEKRYRNIVEDQTEFISRFLPDGTHIFVNEAYCRYFGVKRDDILGQRFQPDIPDNDRDRVKRFFKSLTPDHPVDIIEHRIIMKDGSIRWQRWSDRAIFNNAGKITEYQSVGRDVTDKKDAEFALQASEERYRSIVNDQTDLIARFTPDGVITFVNEAYRSFFAPLLGLHDIEGKTIRDVMQVTNYQEVEKFLSSLTQQTPIREMERVFTALDGNKYWQIWVVRALFDNDGNPVEYQVVGRDITKRKRAEEALQENKQKFRTLVEYSLEGSIIVDFQGKILFTNNAAARMIEAEGGAKLIGRNVMEFIAPESHQDVMRDFEQVARGHDAFLAHYHVISEKGKKIYVESIGKVIPYEGKTADLISIRDITEQKNAENELRESEQKYRILLDGALDPIFSFYPDGTYHYVNRAFAEGVGKSVDQIIGKKIWDVFPKDEAEKRFSTLRSVFSTGEGKEFEVRVPRPDGDRYYVTTIVPIKDDKGSVVSAICSSKEITRRKKVEEALREREEKYRHLIENSHDIIYTMTPLGEFIYVSPSWTLLLGHPVTEVVGKSFQQFVHPDDIPGCMDFLKKTIEDGIRQPYVEYRVQHADGSWRWHISKSVPLRDETGRIIGFEGIASDITGRKQAEEALQQANKKLNLLSSITRHDINNQLLALNGFLELLHGKIQNPAFEEYFDRIEQASTGISTMIEFTREYEMIGVAAPIWHTCRTLVDTVSKDAPLGKVVVKNDLPPGMVVFADPLITRVYYNLMDNAARYGGSITTIRFYVKEHDGNQIIVCEDDGEGIPAEEKERIFNRGFGRNTGMGLYLTREILSITGITIRETGVQGKGGRFEITVPKGAYRFNKE